MKLEFFESDYGVNIDLSPEDMAEVNKLLRLTNNAKATKPQIRFYFSGDTPHLSILMPKVKKVAQKNSIANH